MTPESVRKRAEWRRREERIIRLRRGGWSQQEIATTLGVSRARVGQILKRLSIRRKRISKPSRRKTAKPRARRPRSRK